MSDHAWVQENLAAYVAGGLDAAECERVDVHVVACEPCSGALREARRFDGALATLFRTERPAAVLEERLIAALREQPLALRRSTPRLLKWTARAAAVAGLGLVGHVGMHLAGSGELPSPAALFDVASMDETVGSPAPPRSVDASMLWNDYVRGEVSKSENGGSVAGVGRLHDFHAELAGDPAREAWRRQNRQLGAVQEAQAGGGRSALGDVGNGVATGAGSQPSLDLGYKAWGASPTPLPAVRNFVAPNVAPANPSGGGQPAVNFAGREKDSTYAKSFFSPNVFFTMPTPPAESKPEAERKALADDHTVEALKDKVGETKGGEETRLKLLDSVSANGPMAPMNLGQGQPEAPAPAPAPVVRKIIIRSGDIEFEVESFDSAVATVTRLITPIKDAFVATVNSEKLANGKVKGAVVVRIPPDRLDAFVLELRKELAKGGELKGQRIGSQDITKQYTDLESRLRAARTMEERLLKIIRDGKGEIKDLLQAEKELGVWRTKIEEFEGELRYFGNLAALSTLTINVVEKEIRAPAGVTETEKVQMGVEAEDVEKAYREALLAVAEAKGRVTKGELKQHAAGQFTAVLNFETAADAAGPLSDRLKQLGRVSRYDRERVSKADGGSGKPTDGKVTRADAQFQVSFYNLANVAPRETVTISIAPANAETTYRALLGQVEKLKGRVVTSQLNRQRPEQTGGTIDAEVKPADAEALLRTVREAGEVLRTHSTENPDTQNVTTSKRGVKIVLVPPAAVQPRETWTIRLAASAVPPAYRAIQEATLKAKGRVASASLIEQDQQNVSATLDLDFPRSDEPALRSALEALGDLHNQSVARAADGDTVSDRKVVWKLTLVSAGAIPPRETVKLGLEVADVEQTSAALLGYVQEAKGRVRESNISREASGRVTGHLVYEVPLPVALGLMERFKSTGTVRVQESARNLQVPEGNLATARLDVTLTNRELIVPRDGGLGDRVRDGLTTSVKALLVSLSWLIVGVLVIGPWALVGYGVWRLARRLGGSAAAVPSPTSSVASTTPGTTS